jgi:tetratricopeptide (TPR) repeat protein
MELGGKRAAEQAQIYLGANRPKEAIRVLEAQLVENPDDAECLRLLAQAYLAAASGAEGATKALPAATHAVELNPDDSHGWRLLSLCYTRLGTHQRAQDAARRARAISPGQWLSHAAVAHADASAGAVTDDTRASVAEAIRLGPNQPEVHFAAGRVAQASRQSSAAREHYERTLSINPGHVGARNNLALIDMRSGNAGSAAAAFASLLAENPNSDLALRNLRATGFSALRIVYYILVACVLFVNIVSRTSTANELQTDGIVIAILAVVSVAGYVMWIRRRAGIYFGRFVRSVPSTDRLLMLWAAILALGLAAIVAAVFLPRYAAVATYSITEFGLVGTVLVILLVNRARLHR